MTTQEKLDILTNDFKRLEENRKDRILDLTRKLACLHCGGEIRGKDGEYDRKQGEISGINPA